MSSMRFAELVCLVVTICVLSLQNVAPYQAITSLNDAASPQALPSVVDGNDDPELVPDTLAYRHFMLTTLVPEVASAESSRRLALRLARVGFGDSDREAYLGTMRVLRESLTAIAAGRLAWSSPATEAGTRIATLRRLAEQETQLFEQATQHLRSALTPGGSLRLDAHIKGWVKRHIKIYGPVAK